MPFGAAHQARSISQRRIEQGRTVFHSTLLEVRMALSPVSSDDDMEAAFNPLAPSRNDAFAEPGVAEAFAVADGASVPPSVASSASHGPLDLRDEPLDSAFNAEDPKPPPPPAKDVQSVPAAFMAPRAVEPPKPTGPCCATHAAILKWLQAYGAGNQDAEAEKREMVLIGDSQKVGRVLLGYKA